ncbi:pilus assembly protein TadG-related protein [Sandarakinorhabdus oryzae]|uniref:pilus assembly protein TadG-related protein n=1 Tax=Sandarakinorhabdus oryzae TaxID=2675220 RepID=UPI0012E2D8CE|nr:pilus assembly protein TadG-related protein [Sandarakinorhabdus oryzae]
MCGKSFCQARRDRRGNVVAMTALLMPVLIGAAGLASDTMQWTLVRRSLQRQADSAALAGAYGLSQGQDVVSAVAEDLTKNSNFELSGEPLIENAPTAGPFAGDRDAVRVRLTAESRLPFTAMFLGRAIVISVEATAGLVQGGEYCLMALDNSDARGITVSGDTTLDASCGMHSNSAGQSAIAGQGSSDIFATPVSAVGNIDDQSGAFRSGTIFQPYTALQRDPYAYLPDPAISATISDGDVQPNQTRTFAPGTYRGMNIQGNAVLMPGIYYIDGARLTGGDANNAGLQIGSQATITGSGVTLILTSSSPSVGGSFAGMKINAGATVNLTAPTSGTYQGILIYQDRRAPAMGDTLQINGNSGSKLQGAIYAPRSEIVINGNAGMNTNCLQIVGYRLTFNGSSRITNDCPAFSNAGAFKRNLIRLLN